MSNPTGPGLDGMTVEERLAAQETIDLTKEEIDLCRRCVAGDDQFGIGSVAGDIFDAAEKCVTYLPKALAQIGALEERVKELEGITEDWAILYNTPPIITDKYDWSTAFDSVFERACAYLKARAALTEGVRDER